MKKLIIIKMSTSAEKLVKQTIKVISKIHGIEYEELKIDAKKLVKAARNFDESLLGIMEELMDLGNVSSIEELDDFNIEVVKIYCKIKGLDDSGSDKSIRNRAWKNMEEEFELASDESGSEDELEEESDSDDEPSGLLAVPSNFMPPPPPTTPKPSRKSKKSSEPEVVIG